MPTATATHSALSTAPRGASRPSLALPPNPSPSPDPLLRRGGFGRRLLHSGLLEALTYPHGVDRYVELVRPLLVKRETRAEVTAVRRQTEQSVTLTLRPNANWQGLRAGQFVNVGVEIEGVRESRPYSPAGSEHAPERAIELTVSTHPEGKVSRYLREGARPGMIVSLSEAEGEFVLPTEHAERVLLISGGSGVTPVMAMLRTLCDEGFAGEIGFLNYARSPAVALYGAELKELAERHEGLRVARGFTRAGAGDGWLKGRLEREHVRRVITEHREAATFVCGPPALIEAVRGMWAEDGLQAPRAETFTPQMASFDKGVAEGTVRFARSGREAANSGLVLLEQAEDAGLAPEHGCRMGICNTCSCVKRKGMVRNVITGECSGAREEQIRICVSVPMGDVALDL